MKTKFNLVCDSFTHLTNGHTGYSVHGKVSKYIEWVFDNSSDTTFYVDDKINLAFHDTSKTDKYAWLNESKYIIPHTTEQVKSDYKRYFQVFKNIFTHNQELLELDPRFKWVPAQGFWIKTPKLYKKSKLISFITSNKNITDGHRIRLEWVKKLGNSVDLFGRGFNEIQTKEEGLCDYMFSVVIENGFYDSYFTEKILDCFASGTIPVYLGTDKISNFFNQKGIISLDENFVVSEDLYYSNIEAIKDNLERVKNYEILEDYIYLNYFN